MRQSCGTRSPVHLAYAGCDWNDGQFGYAVVRSEAGKGAPDALLATNKLNPDRAGEGSRAYLSGHGQDGTACEDILFYAIVPRERRQAVSPRAFGLNRVPC